MSTVKNKSAIQERSRAGGSDGRGRHAGSLSAEQVFTGKGWRRRQGQGQGQGLRVEETRVQVGRD